MRHCSDRSAGEQTCATQARRDSVGEPRARLGPHTPAIPGASVPRRPERGNGHWPQLKSHTADFTNVGGRWGGAITAGLFLREFVPKDMNWTHLDIAGPSFADGDKHHITKGGTGFGVATMVEFCSK